MGESLYFGVRVRVWVVAASTAGLVKGRGKVVPWYQAGHWSMNQGLMGLADSPRTRLRVLWSRSERSAVKRSEGPKLRPTCLTVTSSPLWGWTPVPVGTPMRRWRRARLAVDGVFDVDGAELAVVPLGEVGGGVSEAEALSDGGGEKVVPCGVVFGEPAGGGVHDEPLFGVDLVAPGVEGCGGEGWFLLILVGVGLGIRVGSGWLRVAG